MHSGMPACPCDSGKSFDSCCQPYITGKLLPATAELLMRSRYVAYVLKDSGYLLRTWHSTTRPENLDLDADVSPRWTGLKIVACEKGNEHDEQGFVEFIARYKINGKAERLHERSEFSRVSGQWVYLRGNLG